MKGTLGIANKGQTFNKYQGVAQNPERSLESGL